MDDAVTIFANGQVFTATLPNPWVEAMASRGGRVMAVGTYAELRSRWPSASDEDLAGHTLLPGLIDAHNHFLSTGESLATLDLRFPGVDSAQALLAVVKEAAATVGPEATISGFGFDNGKYTLPSLAELDEASAGRRLQLFHTSGHNVLVNSVVLAEFDIDEKTPDPDGGRFVRDGNGRLTGLCLDAACGAVVPTDIDIGSHGPNFHVRSSMENLVAAVNRASTAFLAAGLTCVADAQVTSRELTAYREARVRGLLGVRTVCMPLSHQLDDLRRVGLAGPFGDEWLSIGHLKVYADGTLTGGTAAFSEQRRGVVTRGVVLPRAEQLASLIESAWTAGWRIGVHAQGDHAIAATLDGFERTATRHPRSDTRPRIEHAGYPTAAGIARMANLEVTAVNQPSYLFDFGDEYLEMLGDAAHDLQPWRDELNAGVRVVISSDSDVSSYRPLTTIANAMRRRTLEGKDLGSRHRLSLDEALLAHTIDAAYAVNLEHRIGSFEPGKAADLTVVEGEYQDPLGRRHRARPRPARGCAQRWLKRGVDQDHWDGSRCQVPLPLSLPWHQNCETDESRQHSSENQRRREAQRTDHRRRYQNRRGATKDHCWQADWRSVVARRRFGWANY